MCGMADPPTLETERLVLRPYTLADAPRIASLAGDRDVAAGTLTLPHPYEERHAVEWIRAAESRFELGELVSLAITLRDSKTLIGSIGLRFASEHSRAELGYWLGKDYWNMGYATEASRVVVNYGFEIRGMSRIFALHFTRNPASGRVLQKIGMKHEGCLRQHLKRWDTLVDCEVYGILSEELEARP